MDSQRKSTSPVRQLPRWPDGGAGRRRGRPDQEPVHGPGV